MLVAGKHLNLYYLSGRTLFADQEAVLHDERSIRFQETIILVGLPLSVLGEEVGVLMQCRGSLDVKICFLILRLSIDEEESLPLFKLVTFILRIRENSF